MPTEILPKPQVSISECLDCFQTPHIISDFLSPVNHKYGNASKTSTFSTFPEYLFIHFGKFYLGDDWMPKKLDIEILGTENVLDIEFLRSPNIITKETIMPSDVSDVNLEILTKLLEVGCDETLSRKALSMFKNDFESALSWVLNPESSFKIEEEPENSLIESLVDFGFTHAQSVYALRKTGNNVERAVDYLFSHTEEVSSMLSSDNLPKIDIADGTGHYTLVSIISHIGSSSMSGHYVAHILKEGKWVLFNDDKVTESKSPPFKLGYLYLYKRYCDKK
ncbi:hypothetical protein LOD99_6270 [Oopsacas minuta]|uniref:Ubiquitinyl hydrolase 1 n=1 Tax=Oopsacas minuta TaxID=111878 RepID=A0AAV7JMA5_9METZ|nr:hypothetical protein LOD99_6270 [Oopsacas minuta]